MKKLNSKNERPLATRLIRLILRLFLWCLLLAVITGTVLLLFGYVGASKAVSYLPAMTSNDYKPGQNAVQTTQIKSSALTVSVDDKGEISVNTSEGEPIISGLNYFSSYVGLPEKWGLDKESVEATSDSTISISGDGSPCSRIRMVLTLPKKKTALDVDIITLYTDSTIVRRESLTADFTVPVSEVYRKDRQVDTSAFDREYWVGREGVRFGTGKRSALIYHTPDVSSLQIDTRARRLVINLEYSLDHPFVNIPYQNDGRGKWTDLSKAAYKEGDSRKNHFSINFGDSPAVVPRIMLVPKGFLAGYVFTEHADGGNIRTHRAAYFGSEDITNIAGATGGFARYKIPVTKSIFFANIAASPDSSGTKDPENALVLDFLDQLNKTGRYDICLHGVSGNRKAEEESIRFMKYRFGSATWIDHGMFTGTKHRQSLICDGLNPTSEFFVADLWEKYNTRYFWDASIEYLIKLPLKEPLSRMRFYEASLNLWKNNFSAGHLQKMGFPVALMELCTRALEKGELNSFLPNKGNAFPTPLLWQNPTRTRNFYSWTTDYVKVFSHSEHGVKDEEQNLNKLIHNRGIFINHGYFVRNNYHDGVLLNSNGKLMANPYFNQTLNIMARMKDRGDLYITTIKDLLDYWVLIDNISFEYMTDGTIYINNLNDKPVSGLSLAIRADKVRIDGEIPKFRRTGDDIIFWLDLTGLQSVRLQTE